MRDAMSKVREFHVALDQAIDAPLATDNELRLRLIREEVAELEEALAAGDVVKAADALADIAYVVVGSAVTWGIPLAEVFDEVHRSNMTKRGASKREDGKILKPSWYESPDVAGVLARRGMLEFAVGDVVEWKQLCHPYATARGTVTSIDNEGRVNIEMEGIGRRGIGGPVHFNPSELKRLRKVQP